MKGEKGSTDGRGPFAGSSSGESFADVNATGSGSAGSTGTHFHFRFLPQSC